MFFLRLNGCGTRQDKNFSQQISLTLTWHWTKPGFLGNWDHSSCLEVCKDKVFRKAGIELALTQSKAYRLVQPWKTQSADAKDGGGNKKRKKHSPWYGLKCYILLTITSLTTFLPSPTDNLIFTWIMDYFYILGL